jgi:hypothetical protein
MELFFLAFTIVVLTLLTEHSTRRSSRDIQSVVEANRSENRALIEESKAHWTDQNRRIDNVIENLASIAKLQAETLVALKQLDASQKAALEQRAKVLAGEADARNREIQDQCPGISIELFGWEGKVIKHFVGSVKNDGPPGADADVTFTLGGFSHSERAATISKGAPFEPDFGDIAEFPTSGQVAVTCEVSSATKTHRYRFVATYTYQRNKGFWGSNPSLSRTSPQQLVATVLY